MNNKEKEFLKRYKPKKNLIFSHNKVNKNKEFKYEEKAEDFVGLVFHCPNCKQEMHLHISKIEVEKCK